MIRAPKVRIVIERWEWDSNGGSNYRDSTDVTNNVIGYSWNKSIKNPAGSASIKVFPQQEGRHLLDAVNPMDVVKIWEFDTLKFQGFIRNIAYSGSIGGDGKPQRQGVIDVTEMGGLLLESSLGFNLPFIDPETAEPNVGDLLSAGASTFESIVDAGTDGGAPYKDMVTVVIDNWLSVVEQLVGTGYRNYFDRYINYEDGLSEGEVPGTPQNPEDIFTGYEQQLTMWDILQKLVEPPFMEFWSDEGPRGVTLNGSERKLNDEVSYLIMRGTPFNGSIPFGSTTEEDRFDQLIDHKIPLDYLVSFNFSRTMDEASSVFLAVPVMLQENARFAAVSGGLAFNGELVSKYLYRPMQYNLYYIRGDNPTDTEAAIEKREAEEKANNATKTLKNWFEKNDKYINGSARIMIPKEGENKDFQKDIRIGEKVSIEGIEGQFYVESVAHTWQYQGTLAADIGLTRGYNYSEDSQLRLADAIFDHGVTR